MCFIWVRSLLQPPSQLLLGKDRAAIVAKQLNDFLCLYNRETEIYGSASEWPNRLLSEFLHHAR